jgi:predicted nucleic acid-binding protein
MGSSAMIKLDDALQGVNKLGIDTAPVIYFMEANPKYDALVTEVFQRISKGILYGICSVITLTEVLIQPLRKGNPQLAQDYTDLLLHSQHFATVSIDPMIAKTAANLRARHNLRTPDALQVAAAVDSGCQAFLTNDLQLSCVKEIRVLLVDELEL